MNKAIAIIGCGWLGLPLAESLQKDGYQIYGSTTSERKLNVLREVEITPFLISLSESAIHGDIDSFLKEVDVVVINVPPKLRGGSSENYVKKMALLHKAIKTSEVQKIVFVSSTSVYGDIEGEVTEETHPSPVTKSGRQLLTSENIFRKDDALQTTIVRFGGLIGADRHPINMLSGKRGLSNGNHPINLIHLNDCVQILRSIIKKNWWNEIFNGVFPHHPKKRDYYIFEAKKRGSQVPDFKEDNVRKGKIVRSNRLISVKNYTFTTTL
ncbi:MAG: SDR family oxidoreductase [Aurantibacter sp.]